MSALLMLFDDGFSPRSLFAAGEQGAWYDPSDFSTLYQDSAGTTPVTALGQGVGLMLDKSGRGNHAYQTTAASRPTIQQDSNGMFYLACDGADDGMVTNSIDFTGTDKMSVWAGVRKLSDAASGVFAELSAAVPTNNGSFNIQAPRSGASYGIGIRGSSLNAGDYSTFTAPVTTVIFASLTTSAADYTAAQSARFNGVANAGVANSGSISTGNFGNYPLYLFRRGGTSLPFNGRCYGLIIRGAASTAGQIAAGEAYMNGKTKAY